MAALGRAMMIYCGFVVGLAGVLGAAFWVWMLTRAVVSDPVWLGVALWLLATPFVVLGVALAIGMAWHMARGDL